MEKLLNSRSSQEAPIGIVAMITKLSVSNFKSVRQLDIECKKVNLFIGEPNTGKSNILEALALLSWCGRPGQAPLGDYVRFELMENLFYDQLLDREIEVSLSGNPPAELYVRFESENFAFRLERNSPGPFAALNHHGGFSGSANSLAFSIKFFRFENVVKYDDKEAGSLKPPNGINLFAVVYGAEVLRNMMKEFFEKYGFKLVARRHERTFELQKDVDGWVSAIPYTLTSDTLRRIIFYTVAVASNKDSVLVFEEPESNAFPYYTKFLGERIALDKTNQFFIATHNPYLLSAIIEKARKEDIQVFITYFKDFQTRVKPLTPDQVIDLMEADPFFNLDRFIEAEE
ncbi:MAG: AAA family ATPase [Phycisphaerales bacterium]|nr:MAG: AAA family ATPase [Phycisphaerales bacterium]